MMKQVFFIASFLSSLMANAQVVLIQENVNNDTVVAETGPNLSRYNSGFYSFGMIFGAPDEVGSSLDPGKSFHVQMGDRFKNKINNVFAWGMEFMLDYKSYRIKQDESKTFGGDVLHKKETFIVLATDALIYTRINFDPKRGNYLGKFIDFGAYGGWNAIRRHKIVDTVNTQYGYERAKHILMKLQYVEKFNYGVMVRIGWGGMALYGNYRLSNHFKPFGSTYPMDYSELPRFEVGLNFDIYAVEWKENYMRRRKKENFHP